MVWPTSAHGQPQSTDDDAYSISNPEPSSASSSTDLCVGSTRSRAPTDQCDALRRFESFILYSCAVACLQMHRVDQ